MVKWCESWLERQDENGIKLKYWAQKRDNEHARWILCYCDVKFSKSGIHALMQHVGYSKHKKISNVRFPSTACHIDVEPNPSSNTVTKGQGTIKLDHLVNDKATAAEATWLFKVAESDMSLRDCDGSPLLFKHMFPDSRRYAKFTLGLQKALYVIQDGLGPLLESKLLKVLPIYQLHLPQCLMRLSPRNKERYWSCHENKIVTLYYFFFLCTSKSS